MAPTGKCGEAEKAVNLTTLRTSVSEDEHNAVRWLAKVKLGTTIDDFVRSAVEEYVKKVSGKSLAESADESSKRGKIVQEEFDI